MKSALLLLLITLTLPAFAGEVMSRHLVSTSVHIEALPERLHFAADRIKVLNAGWFNSLFSGRGCESSLSGAEVDTTIEILAEGPHTLSLHLDGRPSQVVRDSRADYVPVYYRHGVAIHPHFLVKLKDWVLLHVSIHKSGSTKNLIVSLVQGRGNNVHLVPIFEATGY